MAPAHSYHVTLRTSGVLVRIVRSSLRDCKTLVTDTANDFILESRLRYRAVAALRGSQEMFE